MKTYVVCIDGTWNHPSQRDADPLDPSLESVTETNVLRVFRFLTGEVHAGIDPAVSTTRPLAPQFGGQGDLGSVLYLSGVGSGGGFFGNQWAGATGVGTWERILTAYGFLAQHHQPGDRIFGFGFSRGAFAVRSLAGLIHWAGLPTTPRVLDQRELDEIGAAYKTRAAAPAALAANAPAAIDFLGIWDTVGALAFDYVFHYFHDLSPANVRRVAHALALDEQRTVFEPEYWNASANGTLVEEVWFSGAHSNIGGGYVNPQLSNIALAWIISRAVDAGLPTPRGYINGWYLENAFGRTRDSHQEFLRQLWVLGRLMRGRARARVIHPHQGVHASVFDRLEEVPSEYSTGGLTVPEAWEPYTPAARFASGGGLPMTRKMFKGKISETPDYLGSGEAAV